MNDVYISVIVPVYNAEKQIQRCINSILEQTYTKFEIIIIDDGSSDSSGIICDKYQKQDKRIHVVHKVNSGVAETRNVGISLAKGEYISFVDADDYVCPDMLKTLAFYAKKYDSDMVMCKYSINEKNGKVVFPDMHYNKAYTDNEQVKNELLYRYYTDSHEGLYSLCNKLIRRSLYSKRHIYFDTTLKRGEDAWFIFQTLKHCRRVDYIDEVHYCYWQNENSIMHTIYQDQYEQWVRMRKRLLIENETLNFSIDYNKFYKEFLYKTAMYCRYKAAYKDFKSLKRILTDSFYHNAIKYDKYLPTHIRMQDWLVTHNMIHIAMGMYMLWGARR